VICWFVTIADELALRPHVEGSVPTACRSAAVLSKSSSPHRKVLLNYRELSLFLRTAGGSHFSPNSLLSPPYVRLDCNFFVSPTYAKTGVPSPQKCRRADISSLFLLKSTVGSLSFQPLAHSFIFRITPISHCSNIFPTLHQKTRVYPPPVQPIAPEGVGPATRRSPTSEGLRYKGSLSPVTNHQSPITLSSPTNLSVAPSLPPAGHWYLRSGAMRFREEEAKTCPTPSVN
jgi:hypothetical protein